VVERYVVERYVVGLLMGVTAAAGFSASKQGRIDTVLGEIRKSCQRRANPADLVDGLGVVGVTAGTAPVLWVTAEADAESIINVVAAAPELNEVYVEEGADALVTALTGTGWSPTERTDHVVHDGPMSPLVAVPGGYVLRECADPAAMPAIRELIIDAFDAPRHVIEASYPDDFFERAAPAHLVVAETLDGELVGVVGRRRQHDSSMLFALAVAEPHRASRLGTALARRATADALRDGAAFVHAMVEESGTAVARSVGFVPVAHWMRLFRGDC
jgi:hypothetical protein